jgi:hypothetical protein
MTRSQCTCPPYGRAQLGQQPVQRGDLTQVEQLEFRDHAGRLGPGVELADEWPRVQEHLVAEVHRAAGQRAGVGPGVEHRQSLLEAVADRAAGGQLDDQVGALAQRPHRVGEPARVQRRAVLAVADVHVDDGRPGRLALAGRRDQLVQRDGQHGDRRLIRLRAGGRDGDQGRPGHPGRAAGGHDRENAVPCEPLFSGPARRACPWPDR